jgi:hypothetical protein
MSFSLLDWLEKEVDRIGLGGQGSGNFKHKGRPGQQGGSAKGSGALPISIKNTKRGTILFSSDKAFLDTQKDGDRLKVVQVHVLRNEDRKKGYAKQLYVEAIKYAQQNGLVFESDSVVHEDAVKIWESLIRDGYPIKKNSAKLGRGFWSTGDDNLPMFYMVK